MGKSWRIFSSLGLILLSSVVSLVRAGNDFFSLQGFGTLGAARSTDKNAQLIRDFSQPDGVKTHWTFKTDTLLGVQANIRLHSQVEAVVQAVTRYRYDETYAPEITWGFLRYDPTPAWTLRAGRLGTEFYMLADSRMVGYSYLTVRPPVDYFATLPFYSIDGADITATTPLSEGLLTGKLFWGLSRDILNLGLNGHDLNMSGSQIVGGYLDFLKDSWRVRLGYSALEFANDFPQIQAIARFIPPATNKALSIANTWTGFYSLGIVYDSGPFQTQFMLSRTEQGQSTYQNTWAGYFISSYRVGEFTPFLGISAAKSEIKKLPEPLHPYTDWYQFDFYTDQRTFFFGTRWDFRPKMSLKAQVDVIRGEPKSRFLFRMETPEWDGTMNVFSLAWDFVF